MPSDAPEAVGRLNKAPPSPRRQSRGCLAGAVGAVTARLKQRRNGRLRPLCPSNCAVRGLAHAPTPVVQVV